MYHPVDDHHKAEVADSAGGVGPPMASPACAGPPGPARARRARGLVGSEEARLRPSANRTGSAQRTLSRERSFGKGLPALSRRAVAFGRGRGGLWPVVLHRRYRVRLQREGAY